MMDIFIDVYKGID